MRTTFKLSLKVSKSMSGIGKLQIRITRHRVTRIISTPYVLFSDEWDDNRQKINPSVKSSSKRKKEVAVINGKIVKDLQLIIKVAESLEKYGDYSSQDIVNLFNKQQHGESFFEFINRKIERLKNDERFGTAHACKYAAVSFRKFLAGKDISINKINNDLVQNYEQFLKAKGKSENAISGYIRSLRAAYNQAMEENNMKALAKFNPFSGVFTGNAKTEKRAISEEDISLLTTQSFNPSIPQSLSFSRDLFLFSFYTQGMSFSDMANLKRENIKGNIIKYNRKKTGQIIIVELENCMKEIIGRYSDESSDLIFPILREYQDCDKSVKWKKTCEALAIYNKNLKKLARLAGIGGKLTSHVARHSWASIASQVGIPIATISRGMGHESEKTTRIYISQLDSSDVGRANRKILSKISKNTVLHTT